MYVHISYADIPPFPAHSPLQQASWHRLDLSEVNSRQQSTHTYIRKHTFTYVNLPLYTLCPNCFDELDFSSCRYNLFSRLDLTVHDFWNIQSKALYMFKSVYGSKYVNRSINHFWWFQAHFLFKISNVDFVNLLCHKICN